MTDLNALIAELKLPVALDTEQAWQSALRLVLPRVLPVMLHRQIPGRHEQAGGGWMTGAPVGAADLSGWARGGLRVELEAKYGRGSLRPEQRRWMGVCRTWGVLYLVLRYEVESDLRGNLIASITTLSTALAERGVRS